MASEQGQEETTRRINFSKDVKVATKDENSNDAGHSGLRFALVMLSAFLAMFLVSLNKLIISTAIPQITDTFDSKDDIGWYGTAYLLTNCSFQLVFGKLYKFLLVKITFLPSLLLFEAGSALGGAAPSSIAFIFGRVIAGLGAGGVLPSVMVIIVYTVPLQKRPKYQGVFGAVFGVASLLGPTVGGAFTTNVTWRWCFYINLPIGGAVMVLVFLLLHSVSFLLLIAFILVQIWLLEQAILPPRLFLQGSIVSGLWASLCIGAHQTIILYYLPIWFQTIQGQSAVKSGIDLLPMVLLAAATSVLKGQLASLVGYYAPFFVFDVCFAATATALFTTLGVDTSEGKWIGYQILYGVGRVLASQAPNMAAQTVLPKEDVAIGASLMQTLFGADFVTNRLAGIPGISFELIQNAEATDILDSVSTQYRAAALQGYNDSLRVVSVVALCMACLAVLGAVTMEWLTVKKKAPTKNPSGEHAAETGLGRDNRSEKEASGPKEVAAHTVDKEAYNGKNASASNATVNERKIA
ncbi:MFS general substrate transporter [Annulohypoxylon truncatum]|uniref:MFS general substrate transporter n=1 Tax=Annulohypoxylon truncatum TaxID=327061 RepID=UPI002008523F|nr:MFS general substrate transporter [Annulohypoxylon truncatum]KAI1212165.1 MFS general substrate transporter [Annulohypoxylon truncatum]